MKLFLLIFFLNVFSIAYAQPGINWQKTYGGNKENYLFKITQTFDNGYVLGGQSNSDSSFDKTDSCRGQMDYWIIKIDSAGVVEWDQTIGGDFDDAKSTIEQTTDSGFIIGGQSYSNISGDKTDSCRSPAYHDFWIVKLNKNGDIQWQKTIGGNNTEDFGSLKQTSDKGFILGGTSFSDISGEKTSMRKGGSDIWILKLDPLGSILWQIDIGGNQDDFIEKIYQTIDGGYIVGGFSNSNISGDKTENSVSNSSDYWVLKLNSTGIIQWQKTIGGNQWDELRDIKQTSDGNYIVAGVSPSDSSGNKSENSRGNLDFWIIKLDSSGHILWDKTIGGNAIDEVYTIDETANHDFIASGYSSSNISGEKTENTRGGEDFWMVRIDPNGNFIWDKTLGGNYLDEIWSIFLKQDGKCVIAGSSASDISGDKTASKIGQCDYWIIETDSDFTEVSEIDSDNDFKIYPNPASSIININSSSHGSFQYYISNILGDELLITETNSKSFIINIEKLNSGIYFLIVKDNQTIRSRKIFIKN